MTMRKILFWGMGGLFSSLWPFYEKLIPRDQVAGFADERKGALQFFRTRDAESPVETLEVTDVIVSSYKPYHHAERIQKQFGISPDHIIDGRVFKTRGFRPERFFENHIAYGCLDEGKEIEFHDYLSPAYLRIFESKRAKVILGAKSYVGGAHIKWGNDSNGTVSIGKYSSLSNDILFECGQNGSHDYHRVFTFAPWWFDFETRPTYMPLDDDCRIEIGNDVWVGTGVRFKSTNPKVPLRVGDGAVIASDAVVVRDIPPYGIWGGILRGKSRSALMRPPFKS